MKKIILLIALVVVPMITNAQSFFDKLEDTEGIDMVVVTKDMFELLSKFKPDQLKGNEAIQVFEMIEDLKSLKVFSADNIDVANTMDTMFKTAINTQNLTELMRVKEGDSRIKIYVKSTESKDFVSEVLMFIKGSNTKNKIKSEALLVSLTGNIDINKISKLADTFSKK
jgi:hypothetical protein